MKITIDIDSATGTASMQSSVSSQAEQAPAPSLVLSQAMDAGSYGGTGTEARSSIGTSLNFEAGIARVAPTPPPTPYRDTFTMVSGTARKYGSLDAGSH